MLDRLFVGALRHHPGQAPTPVPLQASVDRTVRGRRRDLECCGTIGTLRWAMLGTERGGPMLGLVTPVPYLVAVLLASAVGSRALRRCEAQAGTMDRGRSSV